MKATAFNYHRPESLSQALGLLHQHGSGAQLLAGGQSLLAMMNLRLTGVEQLIDITAIKQLCFIEVGASMLRIGALTTHSQLLASADVARHAPLLAMAVPHVAHLAIRNFGTIGGSLALADPAAEYPAVILALNATLVASRLQQGQVVERKIAAAAYFSGLYQTALQSGEMLTSIEIPLAQSNQAFAFDELSRRRGDYAIVGLAAAAQFKSGSTPSSVLDSVRLVYLAMGDTPVLASQAMAALAGCDLSDEAQTRACIQKAQQALAVNLQPNADLQADAATKIHLASVLLKRVVLNLRRAA